MLKSDIVISIASNAVVEMGTKFSITREDRNAFTD